MNGTTGITRSGKGPLGEVECLESGHLSLLTASCVASGGDSFGNRQKELKCSADEYAPDSAALQRGFVPRSETDANRLVTRSLDELRPHPSYARHNLWVPALKLAALEEQGEAGFSHPILITQDNCVIDGYARWELAKRKGRPTLNCIERRLTSEEALEELIRKHRRSQGLTDFIRIELALDLEPHLKHQALLNSQAGGRLKGLSKLTTAEKVNSRKEIARVAQVSVGNVHKVKNILTYACRALKEAARTGEISINLADKWSHEPEAKQQEYLRLTRIERGIRKKARQSVADLARLENLQSNPRVFRLSDLMAMSRGLNEVAPEASQELDAIEVKIVSRPGRAIFVTQELMSALSRLPKVSARYG
jgi:hypothetical protein